MSHDNDAAQLQAYGNYLSSMSGKKDKGLGKEFELVSRDPKAKLEKQPDGSYSVVAGIERYKSPYGDSVLKLYVAQGLNFSDAAYQMHQYNSRLSLKGKAPK